MYKILNFKNKFEYNFINKIYIIFIFIIYIFILKFINYNNCLIFNIIDLIFNYNFIFIWFLRSNYLYNLILVKLFINNIFYFLTIKNCYLKIFYELSNLFCFLILNFVLLIKFYIIL